MCNFGGFGQLKIKIFELRENRSKKKFQVKCLKCPNKDLLLEKKS